MIKVLQDHTGVAISVKLKNGDHFINRDIPNNPCGEEGWIAFWTEEGTLRSYPLKEVEYYEFVLEGDPDDLLTEGGGPSIDDIKS